MAKKSEPTVPASQFDVMLSIVVPSFNEAKTIGDVVNIWQREMKRHAIRYEFLIYDAGSKDGTLDILGRMAESDPAIQVRVYPGLRHGPSILKGYREARGEWVFQMDSDNEMGPEYFQDLWDRRQECDFMIGCRQDRKSPWARRLVTATSRASVRMLFGKGIWDVNSPYRLMRRDVLQRLIQQLPDDTIAPNVILSGLAARERRLDRLRVYQRWIPHQSRQAGTASLARLGLWRIAAKAFSQTLAAAFRR